MTVGIGVMVLGHNDLLLGVGATHPGAITVVAGSDPPGPDALQPGDPVGVFFVRSTQDLSCIGAGGGQQALEVHAGDDVLHPAVTVFLPHGRVEGHDTGSQDHGPHVDFELFDRLPEIDGFGLADPSTDITLLFFEIKTAVVDVGDKGNRLGKVHVNRLVGRYLLIELVRIVHGAVFDTGRATGALVLADVARTLAQADGKIARFAFQAVDFGERQNLYVGVPADLDQFR